MTTAILETVITCPHCGFNKQETMPTAYSTSIPPPIPIQTRPVIPVKIPHPAHSKPYHPFQSKVGHSFQNKPAKQAG